MLVSQTDIIRQTTHARLMFLSEEERAPTGWLREPWIPGPEVKWLDLSSLLLAESLKGHRAKDEEVVF